MNVIHALKTYWHRPVKERAVHAGFVVAAIILLVLLSAGMGVQKFEFLCTSERNLARTKLYKEIGVNLISSVPQTNDLYTKLLNRDNSRIHSGIDPYDNECLKTLLPDGSASYMMCIHDPYTDVIVSGHLKEKGHWDKEFIKALHEAHLRFPKMILVDLGCNIGTFTLPAATLGMEVIAVDPMLDSLKLLQRSLLINGLACHVTLVHNAVHHKRTKMRLVIDPANVGGASVVELKSNEKNAKFHSQIVDAICLDHLVPLLKGKTVFLKIDIEGNEAFSLACAEEFFTEVNVEVLLLGWAYLRAREKEGQFVKSFLTAKNMVPLLDLDTDRVIDVHASHGWPDHVFWMMRH